MTSFSPPHRFASIALAFHTVLLVAACGDRRAASSVADTALTDSGRADSAGTATTAPELGEPRDWSGSYALRGTLEGNRQVAGTLVVEPLTAGAAGFDATRERVLRTYPSYDGPFYAARMTLVSEADSLRGSFTCAHGPAAPPPLVCHPTGAIRGLEDAALVVQPTGSAVVTGSHGEGVTVDYGRFTWMRDGG